MSKAVAWKRCPDLGGQVLAAFSKNSGELIDRGFYTVVVAVVLGALAEVSFRLRQMQRNR